MHLLSCLENEQKFCAIYVDYLFSVPLQDEKKDIIHAIQRREHNIECYGTDRVKSCSEETCIWRDDCLKCME